MLRCGRHEFLSGGGSYSFNDTIPDGGDAFVYRLRRTDRYKGNMKILVLVGLEC